MINNCTEKQENTREESRPKKECKATHQVRRNRSITDRWDQDQTHRGSLQAEGKRRRGTLTWDAIAVTTDKSSDPKHNRDLAVHEDKSNDQRCNHPKAERVAQWSGPKHRELRHFCASHKGNKESSMLARITTDQGTVSRSWKLVAGTDKGRRTYSSPEERIRTRSGGKGETNHERHPPQVPGRGALGSGRDESN